MKRIRLVGLALGAVIALACGGSGANLGFGFQIDRTVVRPNGTLVFFPGQRLTDPIVRVSGLSSTIVEEGFEGGLRVQVPNAVTSGFTVCRVYDGGIELSRFDIEISADDFVDEIEPNNDVDGADATAVAGRRRAVGELTGTGDRDTFAFGELADNERYRIAVTGGGISEVSVNGEVLALDGSGEVEVAISNSVVVSVGNGSGAYEIELIGVVR